jgi:hypothetical protein
MLNLWKIISRFVPLIVLSSIVIIILSQKEKQADVQKRQTAYTSFFPNKECNPDEKRIAKHFTADTLPRLMQKGLVKKYRRNSSGTTLAVNGVLWRKRSYYFKTSLLTEILVHNKVYGYEFSTKIIDSVSGKLYAQILPSTKMNFYD